MGMTGRPDRRVAKTDLAERIGGRPGRRRPGWENSATAPPCLKSAADRLCAIRFNGPEQRQTTSDMSLTAEKITALAPDQASLKAANKLTSASKWPVLAKGETLVWGECQGSGANPYRTVFDREDHGYKCTCPSRKFPCKHALALMWMYVEDPGPFADGAVPDWVTDWLSRRRPSQGDAAPQTTAGKSLAAARRADPETPPDPEAEARKEAAAAKRAAATQASLDGAIGDVDAWMQDQLRTGFGTFLAEAPERCRTIAARLVDGKAQALASRLDELPATLLTLKGEARLDALIQELGQIVLIGRAWRSNPTDPELHRLVATAETRESVLQNPEAPRHRAVWDVVGEQVSTRRDGLVSQATWLMTVGDSAPRFAQLLDFFPASLGKQSSPFIVGEQFEAEVAYYPARIPIRAILAERKSTDRRQGWPTPDAPPLTAYISALEQAPWLSSVPVLLPKGRLGPSGDTLWWVAQDGDLCLPVSNDPPDHVAGMTLDAAVGLWSGREMTLLSAQTGWGRVTFDG